MAAWFDSVETFWEFAPDDTPYTAVADCTWVDITGYVRTDQGAQTQRGRASELSGFSPGSMTLHLDNRTRLFDSSNTAGTYYGKLLPMTKIRWRVVYGGVTAYLFTGFVLGWPITYPGNTDSIVTVEAVDAFRVLQQAELPGSAYGALVAADGATNYWPMQESNFDLLTDVIGDLDAIKGRDLTGEPVGGDSAEIGFPYGETSGLWGGEASATYAAGVSGSGIATMEMWVYPHAEVSLGEVIFRYTTGDTTFLTVKPHTDFVEIRYSDAASNKRDSSGSGVVVNLPTSIAGAAHHLAVTISSTTITVWVDGKNVGTDTLAAGTWSYTVGTNGIFLYGADVTLISHVAVYDVELSETQVKAHWYAAGVAAYGHPYGERTGARADRILDAIGWPSGDTGLSDGETYCGPWEPASANALAGLRDLESSEQGLLFISGAGKVTLRDRQWQISNTRAINAQVTFDDDGTDTPYKAVAVDGNQIDFVRNNVTVTYPGGEARVKDATSIAAYAIQSDSVSATAMPSSASWLALQLANFRLRTRKDPATRVPTIVVNMRSNMTACYAVASLEIGDRVVVNRRPSGGTGTIAANCQVQGIDHRMTGDNWEIRLMLAPAPKSYTEAPYLIAGGSSDYSKVGAGYITLPGTDGNYLSVPDEAALDIVGDLDVRFEVSMDDWTPASTRYFGGKYTESGDQRSYLCGIDSAGAMVFVHSTDGTAGTLQTITSTANLSAFEIGSTPWLRYTIDVDNGAAGNDVKFYYWNGTSYIQIGTTVTTAGVTSIYSGTSTVSFGGYGPGTSPFAGRAYRMRVLNGIGGTKVLDINARVDPIAASFTATTGQTVTVNGSVTIVPATGGNLVPF